MQRQKSYKKSHLCLHCTLGQVYSNTRVPTQVNMSLTRVKTSPTRVNMNESTRVQNRS